MYGNQMSAFAAVVSVLRGLSWGQLKDIKVIVDRMVAEREETHRG